MHHVLPNPNSTLLLIFQFLAVLPFCFHFTLAYHQCNISLNCSKALILESFQCACTVVYYNLATDSNIISTNHISVLWFLQEKRICLHSIRRLFLNLDAVIHPRQHQLKSANLATSQEIWLRLHSKQIPKTLVGAKNHYHPKTVACFTFHFSPLWNFQSFVVFLFEKQDCSWCLSMVNKRLDHSQKQKYSQ